MKRVSDIAKAVQDFLAPKDGVRNVPAATVFHTPEGYEIPDPTPIAPPIGYQKQVPLHEQIKQMIRSERFQQELDAQGMETFEEAEDFEVGDDYDPRSPWENDFDPSFPEIREAVHVHREATERAKKAPPNPPSDGQNAPAASETPPGVDAKPKSGA